MLTPTRRPLPHDAHQDEERAMTSDARTIALGSDHTGVELRHAVASWVAEHGWTVRDVGPDSTESTDYARFGEAAGRLVQSGACRFGIIICGTGVGISLSANKLRGIRCVVCSEPYSALLARQHNDANMLAFGARVIGRGLALLIVETFLGAQFEGGRHAQRIGMIADIEEREHARPWGSES
jgi:ribose 5-phosphate isomerase B